jgi:hypothetical protein
VFGSCLRHSSEVRTCSPISSSARCSRCEGSRFSPSLCNAHSSNGGCERHYSGFFRHRSSNDGCQNRVANAIHRRAPTTSGTGDSRAREAATVLLMMLRFLGVMLEVLPELVRGPSAATRP